MQGGERRDHALAFLVEDDDILKVRTRVSRANDRVVVIRDTAPTRRTVYGRGSLRTRKDK